MSGPAILKIVPTSRYASAPVWSLSPPFTTWPVAFYRPQVDAGSFFFGDRVQTGTGGAYGSVVTAREEGGDSGGPLLVAPSGFVKIWGGGSGAIWAPLAPSGYVALGAVAMPSGQTPTTIAGLGCIRWDQVAQVPMGGIVWAGGDGVSGWVSAYAVNPLGTFYAQPSAPPDFPDENAFRLPPYGPAFALRELA